MDNAANPAAEPRQDDKGVGEQMAAYQKIWLETFGQLLQMGISLPPNAAPPEALRQMRSGVFHGLAKSWDEFLRSPQFLEGMKQWMANAVVIRQMTNDFLTRTHHEMQSTARVDIDTIMLAVRHMEQRVLDRLEKIEERLGPNHPANGGPAKPQGKPPGRAGKRPAKVSQAERKTRQQPKPAL